MECVMAVRRQFTAPILAAAISLSITACAPAVAATVPTGYLQLRFAPLTYTAEQITSFTIGVGTKVAVLAIPGNQDPPGYPTSQDESVVRAVQWPGPNKAPRNWYAFVAVGPGRATIVESYPCAGTGCAAAMAQIVLTVVGTAQTGTAIVPSPTAPPPTPTIAKTYPAQHTSYPPEGYPTGNNAEVLAVTKGASGQPVLTLLIPDMNCTAMYFGIAAMPAPTIGPCVVTFDGSNGHVGPGTDPGTDPTAACPAWPTPQVTFVLDPAPPKTGCEPGQSQPTGLHPGAIGWLVEGGGLPYFALADGTTIRPPAPHSPPRPKPSITPTP
jgi:hypothetical protein